MSSRQPQRGNARSHGRGQREPQQQHKRSRGGSAPCCDAAAVSGACEGSVIVKSTPPALPGLVWDEAKQRYFRLPPSHSHFYAIAAGAAQSTTAVEDTQALQIPGAATGKQLQSSSMSLCSSVRSACLQPHAHTSSQLLPMMRECIAGVGRAQLQAGAFSWSLEKRQIVPSCKYAAYSSRSVVLFCNNSVSLLELPANLTSDVKEAPAPIHQVLQLPANPLPSSAMNVTAALHTSDKYSWLNPGTCIHVAVAAHQCQSVASAAAITIISCQNGIPHSVQSSFLVGARHPCAWLGRGSSYPTLDLEKPICYVAGGRGGQHVAALALDQTSASRTAPEWRMPNSMAVSCMSLWGGCGNTYDNLIFCGGSSCHAVSIDPRAPRQILHHDIDHVQQSGWPGGCLMVCGHVGGSLSVWDMRFTKRAISAITPQKEVFSLWSLSVSANAALALFTKHDAATFLDLRSLRVKSFETQVAAVREGRVEVVSRIGSEGEGCAVFDEAFVTWDAHQAWAWRSRFG